MPYKQRVIGSSPITSTKNSTIAVEFFIDVSQSKRKVRAES